MKKVNIENIRINKLNKSSLISTIIILISLSSCMQNAKISDSPRYIITSPEIAEVVALLGAADQVVGVTTECDYPKELQEKPKVGTFSDINFEKVMALEPTLVFASSLEQQKVATDLQKMGINTKIIYSKSISEMLENILMIGKLIGKTARAEIVVDSLKAELQILKESQSKINKKSVYVEIYGDPIMTVSDSSFVGSLVEFIGANNIFDVLPRDYSMISPEHVINANPEIMITTYPGVKPHDVQERKGWSEILAVKNNKIYTIDDLNPDLILRATPRVIIGMKKMQKLFNE